MSTNEEAPARLELTSPTEREAISLATAGVDDLIAELKRREGGFLAVVDSNVEALCKAISGCNLNHVGLGQLASALEDAGYEHECDCDDCDDCEDEIPAGLRDIDADHLLRTAERAYIRGVNALPEEARELVLILANKVA